MATSPDKNADACGTPTGTARRLPRAAKALGLLPESDGRLELTALGAVLRSDVPGSLHAFARVLTDPVMPRSCDGGFTLAGVTPPPQSGFSLLEAIPN